MLRELKFKSHCRRHSDDVYRFARSLLGNASDAEDATQEILLKLWNNMSTITRTDVRPWLLRTTRNHCIDQIRRRRGEQAPWQDEFMETQEDESVLDPRAAADHASFRKEIDVALQGLSENLRSVFILHEINGLRYREVADALEMTINSVKVYLSRARAELKQRLTHHEQWLKV
jgi:RNA polymerase sigma-70 factor (ECF subfamily)